jgi:hypothetical protein
VYRYSASYGYAPPDLDISFEDEPTQPGVGPKAQAPIAPPPISIRSLFIKEDKGKGLCYLCWRTCNSFYGQMNESAPMRCCVPCGMELGAEVDEKYLREKLL